MPTDCLFRDDSYLKDCDATVVAITERRHRARPHRVLRGLGRPAGRHAACWSRTSGRRFPIANVVFTDPVKTDDRACAGAGRAAASRSATPSRPRSTGRSRYARMRMHTALHLLSAVLPYPVTGGSVGEAESRLDFDIPEAGLDKDAITAKLAEMIATDAEVTSRWITDAELEANPGLVKTMSVKPPMGTGRVRLIEIVGLDLQPCGGTHVRSTAEIGAVRVTQIEKKGKLNRRVRLALV